jgi:hypothetical protein
MVRYNVDQFPTPNSQLPIPNSQFPTPNAENRWPLGFGDWEWFGVGTWELGVVKREVSWHHLLHTPPSKGTYPDGKTGGSGAH